jgi:acyl-CoA dehydrogenase
MTLLFFVLACLVLIYWRATADQSAITLAIATLAGMTLDGFDSSSVVLGLALFGVAHHLPEPAARAVPEQAAAQSASAACCPRCRTRRPRPSSPAPWTGTASSFPASPTWSKLLDARPAQLSEAEQAFVDGPVEELCAMLDDWAMVYEDSRSAGARLGFHQGARGSSG